MYFKYVLIMINVFFLSLVEVMNKKNFKILFTITFYHNVFRIKMFRLASFSR